MKPDTIVTYRHPDGPSIKFDADELLMTASDGTTTVFVDIGILGMIRLGRELARMGESQQEGEQ